MTQSVINQPGLELESLLQSLSTEQLQYVHARLYSATDKDAARAIGYAHETICRWPNKDIIDKTVRLLNLDRSRTAKELLARNLFHAVMATVSELENADATIRLKAAREIMDRAGLVPPSRREISYNVSGRIDVRHSSEVSDDQLYSILHDAPQLENGDNGDVIEGETVDGDT